MSRFQLHLDGRSAGRPGPAVLDASGELDLATAAQLIELGTGALMDAATTALVIDLAAVTFMDSTALGALITIRDCAQRTGKQLHLSQIPERVQKLLEITGLTDVFEAVPAATNATIVELDATSADTGPA